MNARMLLGGVSLLALAAAASAQTDIAILDSFVCDANGNRAAVKVGEPFWVGTLFRVSGTPNSTFKYRAETAYGKMESPRLSFGTAPGEYFVYWGPIPTLMDGPVQVKSTLDPEKKVRESNRLNNSFSFSFAPSSPEQALELFDPKGLSGSFGYDLQFKRNSALPTSLTSWMPAPVSETFQQTANRSIDAAFVDLASDPFDQPILSKTIAPSTLDPIHEEMSVSTMASSVRSNMGQLRLLGDFADPQMEMWLGAEELIEVGRPEFTAWANWALSSFGREPRTTVDVAEALYRSILQKCTYEYKPGASPSAYTALRRKKGDCGALSSLFVALCRTMGIPARTVSGFALGHNNWHVWAEFHVNGAGWVPVDPAYAEGRLAKGSNLPIYFGVIPELNQRVATAFGFDRSVGNQSIAMLQSPAVFWQGRNVRLQKFAAFSELAPSN
jgi:hypothetical protein